MKPDLLFLRILIDEAERLHDNVAGIDPPPGVEVRQRDVVEWHDLLTRLGAIVNQLKTKTDRHKTAAKYAVIDKFAHEEIEGCPVKIDGTEVFFRQYEFHHPKIENLEAFKAWAEEDDPEAFFEPDRRIRKDVLSGFVKRHVEDGEPLPPGIGLYAETKLSRTTKAGKQPEEDE